VNVGKPNVKERNSQNQQETPFFQPTNHYIENVTFLFVHRHSTVSSSFGHCFCFANCLEPTDTPGNDHAIACALTTNISLVYQNHIFWSQILFLTRHKQVVQLVQLQQVADEAKEAW